MFTGLIEATGRLVERKTTGGGLRFRIASTLATELAAGDSLAVNGVCLTVILGDAAVMAATNPANLVGATDRGRIQVGARADLIVLNPALELKSVFIAGREIGLGP